MNIAGTSLVGAFLAGNSNCLLVPNIIQEEELECMPEYWDDDARGVIGKATELYSEDVHSHEIWLLAISK